MDGHMCMTSCCIQHGQFATHKELMLLFMLPLRSIESFSLRTVRIGEATKLLGQEEAPG